MCISCWPTLQPETEESRMRMCSGVEMCFSISGHCSTIFARSLSSPIGSNRSALIRATASPGSCCAKLEAVERAQRLSPIKQTLERPRGRGTRDPIARVPPVSWTASLLLLMAYFSRTTARAISGGPMGRPLHRLVGRPRW